MAQNIWDDAFRNTLQKPGRIERYLADDPASINKVGGQQSLTPLAGACYNGHLEVVTLLLQHNADPNAPCPHGRTALFHAIKQGPRDQLAIVKALLGNQSNRANPKEVYPEDGNVNVLALAIEESQDGDIIQALVDGGAVPTPENKKEAKKRQLGRYLRSWTKYSGSLVDLAVSAVSLILTYTDGGLVNSITKGVLNKMYKITSAQNNPVADDIPEPKSADDFQKNITNFVKNAGLGIIFEKKPDFLQKLAEKASALRDDPNTDLGKQKNIQRLAFLSLYQLVIYCDDSSSMNTGNRRHNLRELVSRITKVATTLLPDDAVVKLRFINNSFDRDVTTAEIDAAVASVYPGGSTPLGTNLVKKILKPLVYDKINDPNHAFELPLLVFAITDGVPNKNDYDIKRAIMECRAALVAKNYDPTSVMFCISQIGQDKDAENFLDELKPTTKDEGLKDVLYCTAGQLDVKYAELKAQKRVLEVWLLEMLTKPVMREQA